MHFGIAWGLRQKNFQQEKPQAVILIRTQLFWEPPSTKMHCVHVKYLKHSFD